jgi:hypothetical protein
MNPSNPYDFINRHDQERERHIRTHLQRVGVHAPEPEYPVGEGLCPVVDIRVARAQRHRVVMFPTLPGGAA